MYFASASNRVARLTKRKSLKPGDRISLTGVVRVDTMAFPTGETQTIHRIALTSPPEMVAKEKRVYDGHCTEAFIANPQSLKVLLREWWKRGAKTVRGK